jgi:hypothetical protein
MLGFPRVELWSGGNGLFNYQFFYIDIMNFRPNKRKMEICLIILILGTLAFSFVDAEFFCWSSAPLCTEEYCPPFVDPCNIFNPIILFFGLFLGGVPLFAIAYIIYSFLEKS